MESKYKNLEVRKKSMDLCEMTYKLIINFPKQEIYWLVDQIKRSSVSIPSNIAEWDQRWTNKENIRFLYIAKWSAAELETQITLSKRLWFINDTQFLEIQDTITQILKMLSAYITYKSKNI